MLCSYINKVVSNVAVLCHISRFFYIIYRVNASVVVGHEKYKTRWSHGRISSRRVPPPS